MFESSVSTGRSVLSQSASHRNLRRRRRRLNPIGIQLCTFTVQALSTRSRPTLIELNGHKTSLVGVWKAFAGKILACKATATKTKTTRVFILFSAASKKNESRSRPKGEFFFHDISELFCNPVTSRIIESDNRDRARSVRWR